MTYADQIANAQSLEQLRDLLNAATAEQNAEIDARPHLMTSLPTFGGIEPSDTVGVWSWDAGRLLVGENAPFEIVDRADQ